MGTDDERLHTTTCPECSAELAQLQRVANVGRRVGAHTMIEPSPGLGADPRRARL